MSGVTELGLQSLAAYLAPGWTSVTPSAGYYIHLNRVYLAGVIRNTGTVGTAVFTGLPTAILPGSPQSLTLPVDIPDPATPGVVPPDTVAGTISPDGTLSIVLPPFINDNPSVLDPALVNIGSGNPSFAFSPRLDFVGPLGYTIVLGNASWPIAAEPSDGWVSQSLAPFLGSNWQDIDSTIGMHGSRVHLNGRVRAIKNGAGFRHQLVDAALPAQYVAAARNYDYTVASGPRFNPMMHVFPDGTLQLLDDTLFLASLAVPHPLFALPQDAPGIPLNAGVYRSIFNNDFAGGFGSNQPTIAGLSVHTGAVNTGTPEGGEPGGGRTIHTYPADYVNTSIDPLFSSVTTNVQGFVHDAINALYPAPDWVGLYVAAQGLVTGDSHFDTLDLTASAAFDFVDGADNPSPTSIGGTGLGIVDGYVRRPGGAITYPYDVHNPSRSLLWQPSDIPDTWTATFTRHTGGLDGITPPTGRVGLFLGLVPLWLQRRNWILAGDVIDLTGAGWQAPYVQARPQGVVRATPSPGGLRPRGWRPPPHG